MAFRPGYEGSAHLYDLFDNKPNIEFFLYYGSQVGEILDIGAGTGRIAIPIAEKGIRVFCIEPSPAMRKEFMTKLKQRPQIRDRITIVESDAAHFKLDRLFPSAFMSGSFDHLLSKDERLQALTNIYDHLALGGKLVFDAFVGLMNSAPLTLAGEVAEGERLHRRFVGRKMLPDHQVEVTLVFETIQSGKVVARIEEHSVAGITNRQEIHSLLSEAGFKIEREFSNYDFSKFHEGDALLILETTKKPGSGLAFGHLPSQ